MQGLDAAEQQAGSAGTERRWRQFFVRAMNRRVLAGVSAAATAAAGGITCEDDAVSDAALSSITR